MAPSYYPTQSRHSELDHWLDTPLPEVTAWCGVIVGFSVVARASFTPAWLAAVFASRIGFDIMALSSIVLIAALSLRIRSTWKPFHIAVLGAIIGDQLSAAVAPLMKIDGAYPIWMMLAAGAIAALTIVAALVRRAAADRAASRRLRRW
jgi:hypothetical protein